MMDASRTNSSTTKQSDDRDIDSDNQDETIRQARQALQATTAQTRPDESNDRPFIGPEWVFPSNHAREEIDFRDEAIYFQNSLITQNNNPPTDEEVQDITVDLSQMMIIPVVDGVVVPDRRCYLKICGFQIFDDIFQCFLNPIAALLVFLVVSSIVVGIFFTSSVAPSVTPQTLSPSSIPTIFPIDERRENFTEKLFEVSGDALFVADSPQNKALNWLIEQDIMNLTYESPNLVQRYSIMVLFYSFSGDEWYNNEGYGSSDHECDWFGLKCKRGISKISKIELQKNNLKGKLPKEVGTFSRLEWFRLYENDVHGTIPTEFGSLAAMEQLYLYSNRLSGTIPGEISTCESLQKLRLQNNKLSGSIPSIWELFRLNTLDLSSNQLVGTIDRSIQNLKNLNHLELHKNQLSGTIPSELGLLVSLSEIRLGDNKIEGTIPSSLGLIDTLITLGLNTNKLSGTMPGEICSMSLSALTADCKDNTTGVVCPCCTLCF